MTDHHELAGRVAIVTGAGRNIGRAIALSLAAGGADVVVNARSNVQEAEAVVREIEAAGGQAIAAVGDVVDPVAVATMAAATIRRFGRIDYLVNNAAMRAERSIVDMDFAEWRAVLDSILDSSFRSFSRISVLWWRPQAGAGTLFNAMTSATSTTSQIPAYRKMNGCRRRSMSGKCTGIPANFPLGTLGKKKVL